MHEGGLALAASLWHEAGDRDRRWIADDRRGHDLAPIGLEAHDEVHERRHIVDVARVLARAAPRLRARRDDVLVADQAGARAAKRVQRAEVRGGRDEQRGIAHRAVVLVAEDRDREVRLGPEERAVRRVGQRAPDAREVLLEAAAAAARGLDELRHGVDERRVRVDHATFFDEERRTGAQPGRPEDAIVAGAVACAGGRAADRWCRHRIGRAGRAEIRGRDPEVQARHRVELAEHGAKPRQSVREAQLVFEATDRVIDEDQQVELIARHRWKVGARVVGEVVAARRQRDADHRAS